MFVNITDGGFLANLANAETGEAIRGVRAIDVRVRPNEIVTARVELELHGLDLQRVEAELTVRLPDGLYRLVKINDERKER